MKYCVKHYEGGFRVFEMDGDKELLIASFHKNDNTPVGKKSSAQLKAEEYCDFLNQKDIGDGFLLDVEDEN